MEQMDDVKESSNDVSEVEVTNASLIPGLPDDISLMCLARIHRKYHSVLKCVSKRWRDLVCGQEWHCYRQKHKLDETWIYALCRDKFDQICCYVLDPTSSRRCWKPVHGLPPHIMKRKGMGFEALGNKLFLLGGCSWLEDATDEVYSYDASMNTWVEAASMSTARCYFACEVLDEKLYAIGGIVSNSSDPHSWDTYDPQTNCWKSHRDPNIVSDIEDSVVVDGKIYIRCGKSPVTPPVYAVYEPSSGTWKHVDTDLVLEWRGPAVVVHENLFHLDQSMGAKLMMWHKDRCEWIPIGKLSPLLTRPPCHLVAVGTRIFVIGKGLSTVVIDVGDLGNLGGMIIGSSIPGLLYDFSVISCKCLSI
ncbi:F-box/kelch-repeat protein SKIP4 [Abrus precatorius]|uniref:F-box/kelch-repeat protein SKIP4 n=1 Tax=Abrus precatorius TaxID=3816 RepID=A0A8B8JYZ8_ABRPR|nr:F-box/kelch-repeat protein SKIP4 [Abrus precatorius]XP_027336737.1 F-box/kelch-repeat protein SKIP4 [Abrus precatorius]